MTTRLKRGVRTAVAVVALLIATTAATALLAQSLKKAGADVQVFPFEGWHKRLGLLNLSGGCDVALEYDALNQARFTDCTEAATLMSVRAKVPLGSATSFGGQVAALTDSSTTTSGTVQSTEYILNSITLPANAFNANTRGVRCTTWGKGATNANAKNYKFYFGATAVATVTGSTDSAKDYFGEMTMLRSGSATQTGYATITSDVGAPDAFAQTVALTEADTAAIVISFKSANTAAAAASATGDGMHCAFLN